jgi:3',5'-cyclic AMP phosphodiesterase CpdA
MTGCRKSDENFSFVFLTDIHVQTELNADEGFNKAIIKVNEQEPDFVITGGDLVMDALGKSYGRADSLYNLYKNLCNNFSSPVYHTIGNHEVFGIYEKSGVNINHPEFGKNMFRKRLGEGKTYSSFEYKGWYFILIDGIGISPEKRYYGFVDSTQLVWLENELTGLEKNTPIVLTTHIPLVTAAKQIELGHNEPLSDGEVIINAKDVLMLFNGYNLKLVLQGHLHILEEIKYKGITFITGGAVSAEWWQGPRYGFEEGFVKIDITKDSFKWEYVDFGWDTEQN